MLDFEGMVCHETHPQSNHYSYISVSDRPWSMASKGALEVKTWFTLWVKLLIGQFDSVTMIASQRHLHHKDLLYSLHFNDNQTFYKPTQMRCTTPADLHISIISSLYWTARWRLSDIPIRPSVMKFTQHNRRISGAHYPSLQEIRPSWAASSLAEGWSTAVNSRRW